MKIRVAYLGPKGTFSHQAVKEYSKLTGLSCRLFYCNTIEFITETLRSGRADLGIVPVTNTLLGKIEDSIGIFKGTKKIDEVTIPVPMCVGGTGESWLLENIVYHGDCLVCSKDRALEQCTEFLYKFFKMGEPMEDKKRSIEDLLLQGKVRFFNSTSEATKFVKEHNNIHLLAIGAELGFNIYDLKIYAKNIGDDPKAKTTFAVIEKD